MKALFEVGEEVILQSKSSPELNGDCLVVEVLCDKDRKDINTGIVSGGFCYKLSIPAPPFASWEESALKKKHTPGDSLESIMSSLKTQTIASHIDGIADNLAEILKGANQVKED